MITESAGILRVLLGATGAGTVLMGATAPTTDIWPKLVAILGGLVSIMFSIMFTTFMKHIYSHTKEAETLIDNKLEAHTELCSAKMHNSIREAVKEGICEGLHLRNGK